MNLSNSVRNFAHSRCAHLSPSGRRCTRSVCSSDPNYCFVDIPKPAPEPATDRLSPPNSLQPPAISILPKTSTASSAKSSSPSPRTASPPQSLRPRLSRTDDSSLAPRNRQQPQTRTSTTAANHDWLYGRSLARSQRPSRRDPLNAATPNKFASTRPATCRQNNPKPPSPPVVAANAPPRPSPSPYVPYPRPDFHIPAGTLRAPNSFSATPVPVQTIHPEDSVYTLSRGREASARTGPFTPGGNR